jgi:hypothetical protein
MTCQRDHDFDRCWSRQDTSSTIGRGKAQRPSSSAVGMAPQLLIRSSFEQPLEGRSQSSPTEYTGPA